MNESGVRMLKCHNEHSAQSPNDTNHYSKSQQKKNVQLELELDFGANLFYLNDKESSYNFAVTLSHEG